MELDLRIIRKSDKKYFLKWWTDKELIKLTSGDTKNIAPKQLTKYFSRLVGKRGHFLILADKKPIGSIYFQAVNKTTFRFPIVIGEKKYRGRGYGSEAIRRILALGFGKYNLKKACLEVRPENKHAIHVYRKLGFRKTGLKKIPKNTYLPVVLKMELSRREWKKTQH